MRIAQCIATLTQLADNRVIDLSGGVTVICGANDSGKSLVFRAIADALFAAANETSFLPASLWENLYLNVTIETIDGRFRIVRNGNSQYTLTPASAASRDIYNGAPDGEELKTALSDDPVFAKSELATLMQTLSVYDFFDAAYVISPFESFITEHFSPERLRTLMLRDRTAFAASAKSFAAAFAAGDIADRIKNPLMSDILNHESELRKIEKDLQILDLHSSKIDKLADEKERTEKRNTKLTWDRTKLENKRENLLKAQQALATLLLTDSKINGLKRNLSDETEKRKNLVAFRETIDTRYPNFTALSEDQRENLNSIQRAYRDAIDARDLLEKRKRVLKSFSAVFLFFFSVLSAAVLASPLLLAGINSYFPDLPTYARFLPLSLIPLLLLPAYGAYRKKMKTDSVHQRAEELADRERSLAEILKKSDITPSYGKFEELFEFLLQYFEEYAEYLDLENEYESLQEMIASDERQSELKREITDLDLRRKELFALLSSIQSDAETDPGKIPVNRMIEETDQQIAAIDEELARNNDTIAQIYDEITSRNDGAATAEELKERKGFHEQKLDFLKRQSQNASFIAETLHRAEDSRAAQILNRLASDAAAIFAEITGNPSPDDFQNFVQGEISIIKNPSIRIIAVLSMKLALSAILEESGISLPLIIDEPASYMDKNRISSFMAVLERFSPKRQIIILTCDENAFAEKARIVKI